VRPRPLAPPGCRTLGGLVAPVSLPLNLVPLRFLGAINDLKGLCLVKGSDADRSGDLRLF